MRSWQVLKRVIEAARDQSGFEDEGKSSRNGRGRREKKGGEIKALILSLIFVEGSAFDLFFLSLDPLSALFLSLSLSFSSPLNSLHSQMKNKARMHLVKGRACACAGRRREQRNKAKAGI